METLKRASEILGIPRTTLDYFRLSNKISTHTSGGVHLVELNTLVRELEQVNPVKYGDLRSKIVAEPEKYHVKLCPCCNAILSEDTPIESEQETCKTS